jgi:solute carrier family 25 thiamine pyrophosphate transporter 19
VREIYREEGARGYFRGLGAGIGQVVPYMGLFFAAYEALRGHVLPTLAASAASVLHAYPQQQQQHSQPLLSRLSSLLGGGSGGGALSEAAMAGVLAGVIAKTGVFPLDLARKRLQMQGPTGQRYRYNHPHHHYHHNRHDSHGLSTAYGSSSTSSSSIGNSRGGGVWATLAGVVRQEGWRALYSGLTVSLAKAAPASAITMWTYEAVLQLLLR